MEASELLEHFLWQGPDEVKLLSQDPLEINKIQKELADVMIYALLLAERLDISPANTIIEKIAENEKKYPVEKAKGTSRKYTEL